MIKKQKRVLRKKREKPIDIAKHIKQEEWEEITPPYTRNTNRVCKGCSHKNQCYIGKNAYVAACNGSWGTQEFSKKGGKEDITDGEPDKSKQTDNTKPDANKKATKNRKEKKERMRKDSTRKRKSRKSGMEVSNISSSTEQNRVGTDKKVIGLLEIDGKEVRINPLN